MMLSDPALDALLKRLHLANTRRAWWDLTRRAEQEDWTYRDFLTLLVSEEIAHRQQTRLDRLLRRGGRAVFLICRWCSGLERGMPMPADSWRQ